MDAITATRPDTQQGVDPETVRSNRIRLDRLCGFQAYRPLGEELAPNPHQVAHRNLAQLRVGRRYASRALTSCLVAAVLAALHGWKSDQAQWTALGEALAHTHECIG